MFKILKTTSITGLTAIALVGAISLPAFAHHVSSSNNQTSVHNDNNNDEIVGGLIGALVGGVIGSGVAGSGNGTEGAIAGALVGGLAGAAIADNGTDRRVRRQRSRNYKDYSYNRRYSSYDRYYNNRNYRSLGHGKFGKSTSIHRPRGLHSRSSFDSHRRFKSRRGSSFQSQKIRKFKKRH